MVQVIFSHGKLGNPFGEKIQLLSEVAGSLGYTTDSVNYRELPVAERIELLRGQVQRTEDTKDLILVGSSMGGYVSAVIANEFPVRGMFLMCPAFYMDMDYYTVQEFSPKTNNITIFHGWNDETVPYLNSVRFAQKHQANLFLTENDHRLSKERHVLRQQFRQFLENL